MSDTTRTNNGENTEEARQQKLSSGKHQDVHAYRVDDI